MSEFGGLLTEWAAPAGEASLSQSEHKPVIEITVAAPIAKVWETLRDPVQIRRWFGWDADTLPDEIDYIFVAHVRPDEAAHILEFEGMPDRIELTELNGGRTCLRLTRLGAAGDDSDWDGANEDMTEGWKAFLEQLRFALEHHPGEERRTFYLAGQPAGADADLPRAALGVDALADLVEGAHYSLKVGPGDTLTGKVWHRSRRQISCTVDGLGDGLILVTDFSAQNRPPHGGGSVIVTTYGLDDAAFDAAHSRWVAWWKTNFPEDMKDQRLA